MGYLYAVISTPDGPEGLAFRRRADAYSCSLVRARSHFMHTPPHQKPHILKFNNSMDIDPIEAALAALKSQKTPNYTATAKKFGIDRTTLSRRHRGITAAKGTNPYPSAVLSPTQRKVCIDYINKLTKRGTPSTARIIARFTAKVSEK